MIFSYKVTIRFGTWRTHSWPKILFFCYKSIVWHMGFVIKKQVSSFFFLIETKQKLCGIDIISMPTTGQIKTAMVGEKYEQGTVVSPGHSTENTYSISTELEEDSVENHQ